MFECLLDHGKSRNVRETCKSRTFKRDIVRLQQARYDVKSLKFETLATDIHVPCGTVGDPRSVEVSISRSI